MTEPCVRCDEVRRLSNDQQAICGGCLAGFHERVMRLQKIVQRLVLQGALPRRNP